MQTTLKIREKSKVCAPLYTVVFGFLTILPLLKKHGLAGNAVMSVYTPRGFSVNLHPEMHVRRLSTALLSSTLTLETEKRPSEDIKNKLPGSHGDSGGWGSLVHRRPASLSHIYHYAG